MVVALVVLAAGTFSVAMATLLPVKPLVRIWTLFLGSRPASRTAKFPQVAGSDDVVVPTVTVFDAWVAAADPLYAVIVNVVVAGTVIDCVLVGAVVAVWNPAMPGVLVHA